METKKTMKMSPKWFPETMKTMKMLRPMKMSPKGFPETMKTMRMAPACSRNYEKYENYENVSQKVFLKL